MKKIMKIAVAGFLVMVTVLGFVPTFPAVTTDVSAAERVTYKHVVVVGVDGMGNFHNNCSTPNMDKILKNNPNAAWTDYCLASDPNISAQCWTSMLTGVNPNIHGITNDHVENPSFTYSNANWPTLFKLIRQSRPNAKMGCYSSWMGPSNGMVEAGLNVDTLCTSYNDAALATASVSYIKENKPEFFFCVFNDVDAAGHSYNWCSDQYYETLTKVDGYVGQVYQAVEDAGMLDDTLFIITTDHGGWTNGHGVRNDDTKYCYFGATGKSINPNKDLKVRGRDMAAIIAYAMNVQGNPNWDSYIPQAMFKDNMTPPLAPDPSITEGHKNVATPISGTGNYIGNHIDITKLKTALFFDDNVKDFTGKQTASEKNNVSYVEGYYGKAISVANGYVSLPNLKFGTDSFAIALWMKKTNLTERNPWDPVIYGNKDWNAGVNPGFALCEWTGRTRFNIADGSTRMDCDGEFLEGTGMNWVHTLVSVDRTAKKVRLYYNFALVAEMDIPAALASDSFDTSMPFNIGQDGTGSYVHVTDSVFDDLLVFNGAITDDQLAGLYNYYFPKEATAAPTKATISTNKSTYKVGEPVVFTFYGDGTRNCFNWYTPERHYEWDVASPYTMTFDKPGTYEALVQTWNGVGSKTSERVTFTVVDENQTSSSTTRPSTSSSTIKPSSSSTVKPSTIKPSSSTVKPSTSTNPTSSSVTMPSASSTTKPSTSSSLVPGSTSSTNVVPNPSGSGNETSSTTTGASSNGTNSGNSDSQSNAPVLVIVMIILAAAAGGFVICVLIVKKKK